MRKWKDEDEQEMIDLIKSGASFDDVRNFIFLFLNRESKYYTFYMLNKLIRNFGHLYSYEEMLAAFKDLYVMGIYFIDVAQDLEYLIDTYRPTQNINNNKILTIYRGVSKYSLSINDALSWTTDREIAIFFANRFHSKDKKIIKASVNESDVILWCNDRKEKEVIVLPRDVRIIEINEVEID